jgi:hypothetical protein
VEVPTLPSNALTMFAETRNVQESTNDGNNGADEEDSVDSYAPPPDDDDDEIPYIPDDDEEGSSAAPPCSPVGGGTDPLSLSDDEDLLELKSTHGDAIMLVTSYACRRQRAIGDRRSISVPWSLPYVHHGDVCSTTQL